jgi:hypothetical protein
MKSKKNQLKKQKKQPKSIQTNLLICDSGHEIEITLQLANKKIIRPISNRSNVKGWNREKKTKSIRPW